ncbi:uncharacterized protein CTRU02_207517 [Colletotrichum truncatum]|uniref:Uncharacterized protein n=1 Tax=Colletotrichum truncatum TaxID=5467 RepID=A0ACC3Z133_COLTU
MAVISPRGIEISNVVLMGFKNSPAYAQRFMDRIFQDHKHFVRAYIDDIVIFSDTDENHLKHVETVLNIINNNRLNIAAKKSFAGFPSVKLLGHIVDGQGIRRTDDRIAAFKNLRFPKNLSDLEKYLGMAGWLRKDIPWYDVIAAPLNERKTELAAILRKEDQLPTGLNRAVRTKRFQRATFEPTLEETEAWETLQKNLCDQVVRYHHNPEKPLFFKIDACKGGFGLMVFQMDITWDGVGIPGKDIPQKHIQPVLFLSKVTSPTEKRYFATEAEVAAVVWAVRKLRKLVQSNRNPVQILTDHAATKGILTHTSLRTMDLNKANLRLASAANYLSQFNLNVTHVPGKLNVVPDALSRLPLLVATGRADPFEESDVLADIHDDENIAAFNSEDDERLGEPGGFTIGISKDFARTIVENYEADPKYGKLIQQLTRQRESGDEWWSPKEADDEENRARNEGRTPIRRRISPWQLSETGFLFHRAYDGTKRLCIPRKAVVEVLSLAHDQKHHFGVDRMLAELASFQIRNKRSVVKRYIAYCPRCKENQVDRQRPPGSLQPIPVVGIPFDTVTIDFVTDLPKPRSTLDVIAEKDAPTESIDVIRKIYQDEAAALIDIANSLRKERYDKKHSDVRFSVGDEVWIRLGKGFHLPGQRHNKWTSRRMGPFRIVRIVSPTAYEVDLPAHWRIFPILSVAQLYKPAQGDDPFNREQQPPQPIEVDGSEEWEIDHIVSRRINRRKREPRIEYLVRWKGFTARFDTWELRESLETNAAELVNEHRRDRRNPTGSVAAPGSDVGNNETQTDDENLEDNFGLADEELHVVSESAAEEITVAATKHTGDQQDTTMFDADEADKAHEAHAEPTETVEEDQHKKTSKGKAKARAKKSNPEPVDESSEEEESDASAVEATPAPKAKKAKAGKKSGTPKKKKRAATKVDSTQVRDAKKRAQDAFAFYPDDMLLEEIEACLDNFTGPATPSSNLFIRRVQDACKRAYTAYNNNASYTEHLPSRAQVLATVFYTGDGQVNGTIAGHLIAVHRADLLSVPPLVNISYMTATDTTARKQLKNMEKALQAFEGDVHGMNETVTKNVKKIVDGVNEEIIPRLNELDEKAQSTVDVASVNDRLKALEATAASKEMIAAEVNRVIATKDDEIAVLRGKIVELREAVAKLQKGDKRVATENIAGPAKQSRFRPFRGA